MFGFASTTMVPARSVGIPFSFGVEGKAMDSGLNWHAPWVAVELMPTTPQSLDASGDNPTLAKDADGNDIFVHNNVRWKVIPVMSPLVAVESKGFENINDMFIQPKLRVAVGEAMATYRPLSEDKPTNAQVSAQIKAYLQNEPVIKERFIIDSVDVTFIDTSAVTKERINMLNAQRADTEIAIEKKKTAEQVAAANRILSASVSKDPNVVVTNCISEMAKSAPGVFPANFQCWPGGSGGVVLPAVK